MTGQSLVIRAWDCPHRGNFVTANMLQQEHAVVFIGMAGGQSARAAAGRVGRWAGQVLWACRPGWRETGLHSKPTEHPLKLDPFFL